MSDAWSESEGDTPNSCYASPWSEGCESGGSSSSRQLSRSGSSESESGDETSWSGGESGSYSAHCPKSGSDDWSERSGSSESDSRSVSTA